MARAETLKVEPFKTLRHEHLYPACTASIEVRRRLRELPVRVQFARGEQEGRIEECSLPPLLIRPTGLTAGFFKAVVCSIHLGAEIAPAAAVGRMLGVRFDCAGAKIQPVGFSQVAKEVSSNATRK